MSYLTKEQKEILSKLRYQESDVGSPALVIARMTFRINNLKENYLPKNKKDFVALRSFLKLWQNRKQKLKDLAKKNHLKYEQLLTLLMLKKQK